MTLRLARNVRIDANAATSRIKSVITLSFSVMFLLCSANVLVSMERTEAEHFSLTEYEDGGSRDDCC